jgi:phage-related tail fiber protein
MQEMPGPQEQLTQAGELFPSWVWYNFWQEMRGAPYVIGEARQAFTETGPEGWLRADGSAVSRTDYADLFDVIGETFGAGDGSTTFNLPNVPDDADTGIFNFIVAAR